MIEAAAEEFFGRKDQKIPEELSKLLKAYDIGSGFRTKIAHGLVAGCHDPKTTTFLGYYLSAPSYSARMRERITSREWWLSAKYFYTVPDIKLCQSRFEELLKESIGFGWELNKQYQILEPGEFHP